MNIFIGLMGKLLIIVYIAYRILSAFAFRRKNEMDILEDEFYFSRKYLEEKRPVEARKYKRYAIALLFLLFLIFVYFLIGYKSPIIAILATMISFSFINAVLGVMANEEKVASKFMEYGILELLMLFYFYPNFIIYYIVISFTGIIVFMRSNEL